MGSIKKCIVIGNLGKDPKTHKFESGRLETTCDIASNESWKKTSGEVVEHTEWTVLIFHGKLAEIAAKYLHKGSKIYAEGRMRTRTWKGPCGMNHSVTETHVTELQFLDVKGKEHSYSGQVPEAEDDSQGSAPTAATPGIRL